VIEKVLTKGIKTKQEEEKIRNSRSFVQRVDLITQIDEILINFKERLSKM
jgi:hypothetical protein